MGLFRRAKKNLDRAAAAVPEEQPSATVEAAEQPKVTVEAAEQPKVTVEAAVSHRETTAEVRPNPDKPGWGQALGQQIGKTREDRAGI